MIYAKSNGQSLYEHTRKLLKYYYQMKEFYPYQLSTQEWEILKIAIIFHDIGKVHSEFQDLMQNLIHKQKHIKIYSVPHNYLSSLFLPINELDLSDDWLKVLVQSIAYHHERAKIDNRAEDVIWNTWRSDLSRKDKLIKDEMKDILDYDVNNYQTDENDICDIIDMMRSRIEYSDPYYKHLIKIKGLLVAIDWAASNENINQIELDVEDSLSEIILRLLNNKNYIMRDVQKFAFEHQDNNLIIRAQTGIGKTESSLLWSGKSKTFFTLPVRTSINAQYDRIHDDMQYGGVGLLHSTSLNYLSNKGVDDYELIQDESRQLSRNLTVTTIDQIFKFPFLYDGYERVLSVLSHSKVIIDEIQGYDPKIVAIIIKGMEMIKKSGGKFLIMTATLPPVYVDEMRRRNLIGDNQVKTFYDENLQKRHRIKLIKQYINYGIDKIVKSGKHKKVLVICNTIAKAQEMFEDVRQETNNVHLLHARFIRKDRSKLEEEIKRFDKEESSGIWITTQLVEASVDIDFDELHTELATLDSLFQRFGRCYRKRNLDRDDPNIYIYTDVDSNTYGIYDKSILYNGLTKLNKYDRKIINERTKNALIDEIYSEKELIGTDFLKMFKAALREMDDQLPYCHKKKEAQQLLRNFTSYQVIPRNIFEKYRCLFDEYIDTIDNKRKYILKSKIEDLSVSIHKKLNMKEIPYTDIWGNSLFKNLHIIDNEYDFNEISLSGIGLKY